MVYFYVFHGVYNFGIGYAAYRKTVWPNHYCVASRCISYSNNMMKRFYNFAVAFIVDVEQILKPIGGFPKAYMMTSSNGNIFRVTGPLCGKFTGPGEFPTQRPVTRSFDVFFDLRLNKRLSKQPWGWWFETPSWSLWRQCNVCRYISFATASNGVTNGPF